MAQPLAEAGLAEEIAVRILESPELERVVVRALDSPAAERLVARVIESRVMHSACQSLFNGVWNSGASEPHAGNEVGFGVCDGPALFCSANRRHSGSRKMRAACCSNYNSGAGIARKCKHRRRERRG